MTNTEQLSQSLTDDLVELPLQPEGVEWPTESWPRAELKSNDNQRFQQLASEVFNLTPQQGFTYALLVIKDGSMVYENYAYGASPFYLQYSWSMAKSVTHALVGILVKQGKLDVFAPAAVPEWQNDERKNITLDQLLRMRSGLEFNEDYVDGAASDVIPMLNFEGRHDTGAFAANKPLIHKPGSVWSYSSGTTNIICRILRDLVGGPTEMLRFMCEELFEPLGMRTPTPRFDTSGTFIGSSFLLATPQDFARFGYLYLRDGIWNGNRVLPERWVDYARSVNYLDAEEGYGSHWRILPHQPQWFYAGGYDGQRIQVMPDKNALIVRCGRTPVEEAPWVWDRVEELGHLL